MVHYPGEMMIPHQDKNDTREVVYMFGVQCKDEDWSFGLTDNKVEMYEQQNAHYNKTDHVGYWYYKIERTSGRVVHPARGHW